MSDTKTLRDEIAIVAMKALLSNPSYLTVPNLKMIDIGVIVSDAYEIADEVVAERKRKEAE